MSDDRRHDARWYKKGRSAAKSDKKMARIVSANYTDDASLKQTHTLITVDSDEIGGVRV